MLAGVLGQGLAGAGASCAAGRAGTDRGLADPEAGCASAWTGIRTPLDELKALGNLAVVLILLVGAIGFGGLFAVYSYLSAAMLATTQAPGWAVPVMLSAFGIGGTLGGISWARLTIRHGTWRASFMLMAFAALTQALHPGRWATGC